MTETIYVIKAKHFMGKVIKLDETKIERIVNSIVEGWEESMGEGWTVYVEPKEQDND